MRILLTNDDGIDAPGLHALREIAGQLSDDVWVAAPETNQSGASHSLSMREPLRRRLRGHHPRDPVDRALARVRLLRRQGHQIPHRTGPWTWPDPQAAGGRV